MRIVAWNCNMALDKKLERLRDLQPDVAVVPESANPDRLAQRGVDGLTYEWIGENPNKGLGVIGFNGSRLRPRKARDIPFMLPLAVRTSERDFGLLAVWARHKIRPAEPDARHVGPVLRALDAYGVGMTKGDWIVAGDFNNHVRWDRPGKLNNHMNAVRTLRDLGLVSAYHAWYGVDHGDEPHVTHYWRDRTKDGWTYHIDYCFIPESWLPGVKNVEVGSFEDWVAPGLSDHVPLVVDVDFGPRF